MNQAKPIQLHVYQDIHRNALLKIEQLSFDKPWDGTRLVIERSRQKRSCVVATYGDLIAGYTIYEAKYELLRIVRLAVHPALRRLGVGTALVDLAKRRCGELGTEAVICDVPERALTAQQMFRSCGMPCDFILHEWDDETGEALYRFVWGAGAAVVTERKGAVA